MSRDPRRTSGLHCDRKYTSRQAASRSPADAVPSRNSPHIREARPDGRARHSFLHRRLPGNQRIFPKTSSALGLAAARANANKVSSWTGPPTNTGLQCFNAPAMPSSAREIGTVVRLLIHQTQRAGATVLHEHNNRFGKQRMSASCGVTRILPTARSSGLSTAPEEREDSRRRQEQSPSDQTHKPIMKGFVDWYTRRIRTSDLLLRRQTLYPAELRVHVNRFYRTGETASWKSRHATILESGRLQTPGEVAEWSKAAVC